MIEGQPILFGEVLFDCFADGNIVLGGAPFNVAWHLQGLGVTPLLISRVGSDERGGVVLRLMREWGLPVEAVQVDAEKPTGVVAVQVRAGEPHYHILPDQAYDAIDADEALAALRQTRGGLLYHGSLILRNAVSRAALQRLQAESDLPLFLDLNIRDPWWNPADTVSLLRRATWVKLNSDELNSAMHGRFDSLAAQQQAARELFVQCELEMLVVTRGAQGAFMVLPEGIIDGETVPTSRLVDTVGAGDGFSAVLIAGLMRGLSPQQMLDQAIAFASALCERRGATAQDEALYSRLPRA
ncbi:MAG TPA: carbohydrate kinase [Gammaproteobacteria bacterium]|nr:carbohydrate kinase [Gammaproteobacteria bacterium]